jgi:hypothetical protein
MDINRRDVPKKIAIKAKFFSFCRQWQKNIRGKKPIGRRLLKPGPSPINAKRTRLTVLTRLTDINGGPPRGQKCGTQVRWRSLFWKEVIQNIKKASGCAPEAFPPGHSWPISRPVIVSPTKQILPVFSKTLQKKSDWDKKSFDSPWRLIPIDPIEDGVDITICSTLSRSRNVRVWRNDGLHAKG